MPEVAFEFSTHFDFPNCFYTESNIANFRALPDITVRSGSPANFQSPDSPKTGRSPSRTPDFYHLKKWGRKSKKKSKRKIFKKFFQDFFFLFIYLVWELLTPNLCSGTFSYEK